MGVGVQEWLSKTFHVIDSLLYPVSTIGPTTVGPAKTNFQKKCSHRGKKRYFDMQLQ